MSKQELELVFPSRDMEKQIILYKKEHFDRRTPVCIRIGYR